MHLPKPRGTLSEAVIARLDHGAGLPARPGADDAEDAALALWTLYELSYRGFDGVDEAAEWDVPLLTVRRELEDDLEARLRSRWPGPPSYGDPAAFADALLTWVDDHDGPSLARFVQRQASVEQTLELLRIRSLYHLKESDPVAWAVPRLPVGPRAALAELQYDEYGGGRPDRLHAHLFAEGLAALGLAAEEGAQVDDAPLPALEQNNAMSLFGLHRRLRGAAVGHLAAFEATSSGPCRRMSQGLARLGLAEQMRAYYDEHVEADAVHEQVAARAICGALVAAEPEQEENVWFGAFTCLDLEDRLATFILDRWEVA